MNRSLLLDNAKLVMIFLVVMGHILEPLINQSIIFDTMFKSIYSFHMPVFIFIAGLLTKQHFSENNTRKVIESIFIPLLAFTILFEIAEIILHGSISNYTRSLSPYWMLWFLFSLLLWRIFAPFFMELRYPILISIFISLGAGYVESIGYFMGLSRTFYFLPFFLMGLKFSPEKFSSSIIFKMPKVLALAILVLNMVFFYILRDIDHYWLYGSYSYAKLGVGGFYASIIRFGFIVLSCVSGLAVLRIIPDKRTFYTSIGSKSLYIYLWHGFIIKALTSVGVFYILSQSAADIIVLILMVILSSLIVYLFSMDIVCSLTDRCLFSPISKVLFRDKKKT